MEKYITYTAIEFAADTAFINYVKEGENQLIWDQWIQEHPEKGEEIAEATALIHSIYVPESSVPEDRIQGLWSRIEDSTKSVEQPPAKVRKLRWAPLAAAASIALLISIFLFNQSRSQTFETGVAEQMAVNLPDASEVQLNAGSSIRFSKKGWNKERQVKLEGEAFFEVEKGSQFVVKTDLGEVAVLGTSFNVKERGQYLEVSCHTGRVQVTMNGVEEAYILAPGDQILFDNEGYQVQESTFDPEIDQGWQEGVFQFKNIKLAYVFDELERQYNVKVNSPYLPDTYTGSFKANQLDSALYQICWPMRLTYSIDGDEVIITK